MAKKISLLTGRAFMCLGISDAEEDCIKDLFKIGQDYLEVKEDVDGINLCEKDDLLLATKNNLTMYVSRSDFALMLDLTEFNINLIKQINDEK